MNKATKSINSTALPDTTKTDGANLLTTKAAKLRISTSTKPSTSDTIKVLGASNRTTILRNKMGVSQVSAARRSTITSRRMSGGLHTTLRAKKTPTKRMTTFTFKKPDPANDCSKVLFTKSTKTTDKLPCPSCDRTFFFNTALNAHLKSHTESTRNDCKHCRRNFAIPSALEKHLRENCTKISVAERKKLLESDAQLEKKKTPVRSPRVNRATDELLDLVFTPTSGLDRLKCVPFKDFAPIKGMGRTPRKMIKCFECRKNFKNPLEFALHAEQCAAPTVDLKPNLKDL